MRGPCLSKQVCQACKRVRRAEFDHAYRTLFKGTKNKVRERMYREMAERPAWTDRDEHDWHERGVVNCVKDGPGFSVDGPPPKGCLYTFEHTVSQEQLARGPCQLCIAMAEREGRATPWTEADDEFWAEGFVRCPSEDCSHERRKASTLSEPPEWCTYNHERASW